MLCMTTIALASTSCTMNGSTEATEPATQPQTEAPTQAPTLPPTELPTEAPTEPPTEAPTLPPQQEPENTTFEVIVNEAPTQPPTEAPTVPQTVALLQPIVGEWYLNYYEQSNGQQTKPGGAITYTFGTNGVFSVDNRGTVSTGSFYFDGTTITYKADASGEIGTFTYNATEKKLTDVDQNTQMSAVFTRQKPE